LFDKIDISSSLCDLVFGTDAIFFGHHFIGTGAKKREKQTDCKQCSHALCFISLEKK
jgi:hypothetical protein